MRGFSYFKPRRTQRGGRSHRHTSSSEYSSLVRPRTATSATSLVQRSHEDLHIVSTQTSRTARTARSTRSSRRSRERSITDLRPDTHILGSRGDEARGTSTTAHPIPKPKLPLKKGKTIIDTAEESVIIHVHDAPRGVSKDFSCQRKVLLDRMKYFQVYLSSHSPADVDISVHCDILIFQWLMDYIAEQGVELEVRNVVSVLISADFLQMPDLIETCLDFIKTNFNDVVKMPLDLSCIREELVARLAQKFELIDLDLLIDRKNRLLSKIIMAKLDELMSNSDHTICRCQHCGVLYSHQHLHSLTCFEVEPHISFSGDLIAHHTSDPSFDINMWVVQQRLQAVPWRSILWGLYGLTQLFECTRCGATFDGSQVDTCPRHTGTPVTDSLSGCQRYDCCQEPVIMFTTKVAPKSRGCQLETHEVPEDHQARFQICVTHAEDMRLAPVVAESSAETESRTSRDKEKDGKDSRGRPDSRASGRRRKKKRKMSAPKLDEVDILLQPQLYAERMDLARLIKNLVKAR